MTTPALVNLKNAQRDVDGAFSRIHSEVYHSISAISDTEHVTREEVLNILKGLHLEVSLMRGDKPHNLDCFTTIDTGDTQ